MVDGMSRRRRSVSLNFLNRLENYTSIGALALNNLLGFTPIKHSIGRQLAKYRVLLLPDQFICGTTADWAIIMGHSVSSTSFLSITELIPRTLQGNY